MGASGEFEKLDAVVEVVLVGILMLLDRPEEPTLLGSPLGRLAFVELQVDATVEPIDVHGVEAVLQALVLGPEPHDGLLMLPLLVLTALPEGGGHPVHD